MLERFRAEIHLSMSLAGQTDVTTVATIPAEQVRTAHVVARADGTVSGLALAELAYWLVAEGALEVTRQARDGDSVKRGDVLMTVTARSRDLLTAERTEEYGSVSRLDVEEFVTDEGIRTDTSAEQLAALTPAFADDSAAQTFPELRWTVTAGNSSQISDGAAALLIMSADKARTLGLAARWRFHTFAVAGADPVTISSTDHKATTFSMVEMIGTG